MGLYKDLKDIAESAGTVVENVAEVDGIPPLDGPGSGTPGYPGGDPNYDDPYLIEDIPNRDPDTLSPETFETSYNKMAAGGSTTSTSTPTSPRQPVATPPLPQPIDPTGFVERRENESYREAWKRAGGKLAPEVPDSNPYDGSVLDHNAYAPNKYLKGRTSDFPIPSDQFDIEGSTDKQLYEQIDKKRAQDISSTKEMHEIYRRRIEHAERTDYNNQEGFAPGQKPGEMPSDDFIKNRKENPLILYGPDKGRLGPPLKPGQIESDRRVKGGQPTGPRGPKGPAGTSSKPQPINVRANDPVASAIPSTTNTSTTTSTAKKPTVVPTSEKTPLTKQMIRQKRAPILDSDLNYFKRHNSPNQRATRRINAEHQARPAQYGGSRVMNRDPQTGEYSFPIEYYGGTYSRSSIQRLVPNTSRAGAIQAEMLAQTARRAENQIFQIQRNTGWGDLMPPPNGWDKTVGPDQQLEGIPGGRMSGLAYRVVEEAYRRGDDPAAAATMLVDKYRQHVQANYRQIFEFEHGNEPTQQSVDQIHNTQSYLYGDPTRIKTRSFAGEILQAIGLSRHENTPIMKGMSATVRPAPPSDDDDGKYINKPHPFHGPGNTGSLGDPSRDLVDLPPLQRAWGK